MKIGGFNQGNWGRKGNDNGDDKKKDKVDKNNQKVTMSDDSDDDSKQNKKDDNKNIGRRGGRSAFDGLGARMRQGLSGVRERIGARVGGGHGEDTRGRLREAGQRAAGLGRIGGFFTGLSLVRIGSWMRNAAQNMQHRRNDGGDRHNDLRSKISSPVDGSFEHTSGANVVPGEDGRPNPAARTNAPGSSNPADSNPSAAEGKSPVYTPRNASGSTAGSSAPPPPVPSRSGVSRAAGGDGPPPPVSPRFTSLPGSTSTGDGTNVFSHKQLTPEGLKKVASEILGGVSSAGGSPEGSPYTSHPLPDDGSMGERHSILGSPLTLHSSMSGPAERMHRFLHDFRNWPGDSNRVATPGELRGQVPAEMREINQRMPYLLGVLPEVVDVGNFRDGSSITINPRAEVTSNREGIEERFQSEPVRVRLGDPTPFRDELDAHHSESMSQVGRLLASSHNPFSSNRSPISIAYPDNGFPGEGIRRLFGGRASPENEILRRMESLTPAQRTELGNQVANVMNAVRLIPFSSAGLRAEIYFPNDGDQNTMPRVVLDGFDHVIFESEVGAGNISRKTYEDGRSRNLTGALHLRDLIQNNFANRVG